jgi:DNA polymerase (family 10)
MQKDEVVSVLREMADLLEITQANPFEVMAYRNGAQSLEDWFGDLDEAAAGATLTDIPAVGKGLARVISDLVRSGSSDELARVRGLVPPGLPALLRVRGLGPKRVGALWRELGVEGTDDLRRAAAEGSVQSLRGFGAKIVERILSGLDYLEKASPRPAKKPEAAKVVVPKARKAAGRLWAGTSGYSYPQWKGRFYPKDARADDFLALYARRLETVEINNTFYRFPS